MATDSILLQGGTVLTHEGAAVKILRNTDLLISGDAIADIGQGVKAPEGTKVIDCKNKIVSPGFIDTHHHLWQSQLKGRHGDQSFLEYMVHGNSQSFNYTPDDIFWGQLGGCLESIDGGVTTVVDHSHMTYSAQHVTEAIRATASSGLRAFFCYTPIFRTKKWTASEYEVDTDLLPSWVTEQIEQLAKSQPFGDGRVYLGLGFDGFALPKEIVVNLWEQCRKAGVKLFTTHYVGSFMQGQIPKMADYGLFSNNVLVSHANDITKEDAATLTTNNIFFSTTPDTELQMGLGLPVAFREDLKTHASVGIDCHSNNSSDVLTQLRLAMQHARGLEDDDRHKKGEYSRVDVKLQDVFNLGTIQGAKAVNMADKIGSLEKGKLADIVIFDATTPSMLCAADENPLAAILLHASVRDIETVIVGGKVRKEGGRLVDVDILNDGQDGKVVDRISWNGISKELLKSRENIKERADGQSGEAAMQALVAMWSS